MRQSRRVLVYRLINGCWQRFGVHTRHYLNHLECGCRKCEDIKNRTACIATEACPNNNSSFCHWKSDVRPEGCTCCTPVTCPPPKIFSRTSCTCISPSKIRVFPPRFNWCKYRKMHKQMYLDAQFHCSLPRVFSFWSCACRIPHWEYYY